MKIKSSFPFLLLAIAFLVGCTGLNPATPTPGSTGSTSTPFQPTEPISTLTPTLPPTPVPTATQVFPPEGRGPTGFAANVDPLTGLEVPNPDLLNRRPIVVKVENLPRADRPQYGLNQADIVYEYYTEEGTTRFAAIYYGNDSTQVGPIRSGRYFDVNVVQAYKANFVFGYAWAPVFQRFQDSDFGNRLIVENDFTTNVMYRRNELLFVNTSLLPQVYTKMAIDNSKQNQEGMFFQMQAPAGGSPATTVYARYSGAIYNQWKYDPAQGVYLRSVDSENAFSLDAEKYVPLVDKSTGVQISASNVVTILVNTVYVVHDASGEVVDMTLLGTGTAYIARDGQIYPVQWTRMNSTSVLSLIGADGKPFPFKPGVTWFEIMGTSSSVTQPDGNSWRFTFSIP